MNSKKSIPYLLAIIILLSICSALSVGYIIGTSANKSEEQDYLSPIENKVTNDIEELKSIYNSEIEEKTATYKELENEKMKVQGLLLELKKAKTQEQTLLKYKTQYQDLEAKMRLLVDEIAVLKSNKSEAVAKVASSKSTEVKAKRPIKKRKFSSSRKRKSSSKKPASPVKTDASLVTSEPIIPEKKVEYVAAELKITDLQAIGFKIKSTTKNEIIDVANKVDFIKISFTLDVNSNEKPSEKRYYIQVIDSKNNILGKKITEYLDDKTLTYSTLKTIIYDTKNIQVEYDVTADKFAKGTYFVNIFDRSNLVAKTSFTLK